MLNLNSIRRQTRDLKMSEKQEKKVVGKTVAIALGIICIILTVGLVGTIVKYTSMISDKDSTISSQSSQIFNFSEKVVNLTQIVELQESKNWLSNQPVSLSTSGYTYWNFSASYAGYGFIVVSTNNVMGLYIRVIYYSLISGVNYNQQINDNSNIGSFPILPSTSIQIRVGTNSSTGMTGKVSVTYYY
jgi:cell division protein FtsL